MSLTPTRQIFGMTSGVRLKVPDFLYKNKPRRACFP